jgi:hypothetical protein
MTEKEERAVATSLPPHLQLYYLASAHYVSHALYVLAQLNIADHIVAAGGVADAEWLARVTQTHAPSLRRVLRLLVTSDLLAESEDGRFSLTPLSTCLRTDVPGSFRSSVMLFTGPGIMQAWHELLHSVRTGETGTRLGPGEDPFSLIEKDPEDAKIFDEAMAAHTAIVARAVADVYDFSPFRTIVDVGGGNGALLAEILRANPELRGMVFELPRVAERARTHLAAAGLAGRCEVVEGDCFAAVPPGGDAYLLKHVIHDWNDERAAAILRNVHRAMPSHARLLLIEGIYPPRVDNSIRCQGAARNDVNMLVCTGGRQRSEAEFHSLFAATGFALARILPTRSTSFVIEAERRA